MNTLTTITRILLGLMFFVFGLNGFLKFMPPMDLPQPASDFMGALVAAGYFMPFLKLTETICGLLLLIGRFVPLALTVLAPVVLNIFLFHLFLAPGAILPAVIALILGLITAYGYRGSFRGVLAAKAEPTG